MSPTDYLDSLGWLGSDVWMAHGVHLDEPAIARYAETGTGVAHCPSSNARLAAGIAPVRDLLRAGVPVGLGVDGAASNESGQLGTEIREAVLMNRLRTGADSMSVRAALRVATMGGARVLGREAELGSLDIGQARGCRRVARRRRRARRASSTPSPRSASAPSPRSRGSSSAAARWSRTAGSSRRRSRARRRGRRGVARARGAALRPWTSTRSRSSVVPPSRADAALRPGEVYLAGGTWLYSEPQPGVTGFVDVTALGWPSLTVEPGGPAHRRRPAPSPSSSRCPAQPGLGGAAALLPVRDGPARLAQGVECGHRRRQHLPVVLRRRHGLARGDARRRRRRSGPPTGRSTRRRSPG